MDANFIDRNSMESNLFTIEAKAGLFECFTDDFTR